MVSFVFYQIVKCLEKSRPLSLIEKQLKNTAYECGYII